MINFINKVIYRCILHTYFQEYQRYTCYTCDTQIYVIYMCMYNDEFNSSTNVL